MIIAAVLQQHADDAAALASNRHALTSAAGATLARLRRADDRLMANLEGLEEAVAESVRFCDGLRESLSPGGVFTLAVRALQQRDRAALAELIAIAAALPEVTKGLLAAFGWVERSALQGVVTELLGDRDPYKRMIGVAACALHRVDPGRAAGTHLHSSDSIVCARAHRFAGELGSTDLLPGCLDVARGAADEAVGLWAAWSAVLLGDRHEALEVLTQRGLADGAHRRRAFRLAVQAMSTSGAHSLLQQLATDPRQIRWLIQGSGIVGNPEYVPWLIRHMADIKTARIAGEAFELITGAQLGPNSLDRPAPENFESGPTDDPDDPNVDMDEDDGLSWPDPDKVRTWWSANESRFQEGTRYFMGAPVTREHCVGVLRNGYQRQRILAAHYLSLLEPGTPLFNTSAPAWRQQRWLARM